MAIWQISTTIPNGYELSQNYPNPFNPVTNIEFKIPERIFAELKIFDITGKLVTVLFNNELSAGTYSAGWDASNHSSGVYFYSIITSKFTQTKKMLMVK